MSLAYLALILYRLMVQLHCNFVDAIDIITTAQAAIVPFPLGILMVDKERIGPVCDFPGDFPTWMSSVNFYLESVWEEV